jgi:hypothetical protein
MFWVAPARSCSLLTLLASVWGCGDAPGAIEPRRSEPEPPASGTASMVATPLPLPSLTKRAKAVSIGRIVERFTTGDICETDADCVVVSRHKQVELCPPGTVTNRRGFESDENWAARGFAFRKPRTLCIDPRTTLRPLCIEKQCAGEAVPAGEADTESETRVWAAHDQLETCQREAVARNEPGLGDVVFTLVIARDGNVASIPIEGSLPDLLKSCLYRALIRLEFSQPDDVRKLRVPLQLRSP